MRSGHGRNDYTLERMLERRNRNNIRKVLEQNGRRLTAKEIDIVNLCTRHPDQRYMLFTYYCDANCMRLNPYVLPHLSMLDHYLLHHRRNFKLQQNLGVSSDCDRSASTSFVAPFFLQLNLEVNAGNDCIDRRAHSGCPSTSLITLPCYFLTDRPEVSSTSTSEYNSTVNLIADTIVESLKSSSDKGNSEKNSSDKGIDENGSSGKNNSTKSSRKNSKKKNRKKGGTKARLAKTQTRSDNNLSNKTVFSSDFSSSSHVEILSVAGDGCDQRVKSDTESILRCISNNMSDQCCANVSCSKSILSDDEGENMKLALSMHTVDAIHEDPSAFEKVGKADEAEFSSNSCINNEFIPVVSGKRRRYEKRYCQQGNHSSRSAAFNRRSGDQFSTWQEKPSKIAIRDKPTSHMKCYKPRSSRTETSMTPQSVEKVGTSTKPGGSLSRHLGECVFKKDDFPSLPSPDNDLKVVRCKVRSRSPEREDLKNPHFPLPRKVPEQCKESESEVGIDIKFSIPFLEVTIGEVEESGSGSGSSSGAFFSPDSSKSSEMNQSSRNTSGTDSPRSSKASDEAQVRSDLLCYSDPIEGRNVSQSGGKIFALNDKSITDVTQPGCGTCLFDLNNNTPTDVDAFKSGSLTCSSAASTTPVSPTNSMSCLNVGGLNNAPTIFHRDLEKILSAVRAADKVYQRVELVQAKLGGPLADYELLCRCAAPVVSLPPRQIIDMPLQNIWQWYEEPSCYALEVKGCQDHQQLVNFNAHFVPSLSAVQLFVRRGPSAICSKHMPKQDGSEFAPCVEDVLSVNAGSAELVFEYFEHEQPYFRQTLFGKVKKLVDGVAQGRSYVNGDAHNLEELLIGDLHPASWYSVAWYPTYRVPEGRSSFKAAFLTYHSLVHFVQRVASPLVDDRVVASSCPVVGLMSYNTQDESWYHERFQTKGDIMEERLESLNLTAVVMARAQVMKDDQVSMNHHPDFEFFASRQYPN